MSLFVMVRAPQIGTSTKLHKLYKVQRIHFYLIIRTNIVATETILFNRRTHTESRKYTHVYTMLIKTASMPLYLKDTS